MYAVGVFIRQYAKIDCRSTLSVYAYRTFYCVYTYARI